jgi:RNA polymerase sigma factor (sigma-70 family)
VTMSFAGPERPGFDDFYRQEYRRLAGALWLACGDRLVAEELAQETFVRAIRAWNRVVEMDRPDLWLHTVGFNLVRRRWKRRTPPQLMSSSPRDGDVDARLDLIAALARLSADQRRAVVLRYVLGYSAAEVATVLGRSPEAVRSLCHRAIAALRTSGALSISDTQREGK